MINNRIEATRFLKCIAIYTILVSHIVSLIYAILCIQIIESGDYTIPGSNNGTVAIHSLLLVECLSDVRQNVVHCFDANR
jgi:hypothetical protein